jgi:hypothetical protein
MPSYKKPFIICKQLFSSQIKIMAGSVLPPAILTARYVVEARIASRIS